MKIPTNEKITETYLDEGVKEYIVTYYPLKDKYTLHKIVDDKLQKIKTADTPAGFGELVKKDKEI